MAYTDIFTGSPIQATDVGFVAYTLTANKVLVWPSTAATEDTIAKIMQIECNGAFSLTLGPANQVSPGEDTLITNTGSTLLTVLTSTGATITTVASGAAKYIYLTDNSTEAGVWASVAFGVGTANVDAAALAGYGLLAISTTLNQACPVTQITTNLTVALSDRARLIVDTAGVTVTLPSAATAGNNYFVFIRNGSSGTTTVAPVGGDLIDTAASASLNPSESIMVICSGTAWYTVGWGRSVDFNYTQLTKNVAGGSNVTLTSAEAGYKILKFTGLLTANINVIVPTTTTIWYVDNATTGSFTITVKTSAGSGVATANGSRYVLYGDGTNVVNAVTTTGAFSSFTAGSASAPSITFAADTDTGIFNTAANQVGVTVGGSQVANFIAGGLNITGAIAATGAISAASASLSNPLPVASGGLAISSYTIGDIVYASGTTAFTKLTAVATGNALISGGVGTAPSWGKIGLTTHVSGTLPVANGGTNGTTAAAARTSLGVPAKDVPAFSAYQSTLQSIPNNTLTKVLCQTEEFDTNSVYDTSNSRFTPNIAGYYQVSGGCYCVFTGAGSSVHVYKNGSDFKAMSAFLPGGDTKGSCLVYLNGSTDYIELYYIQTQGASQNTTTGILFTFFQAVLARQA